MDDPIQNAVRPTSNYQILIHLGQTANMIRRLLNCNSCGFETRIITELTEINGEWSLPILCLECRSLYEIPIATPTCPISDSHTIRILEIEENDVPKELLRQLEDDLDKIFGKISVGTSATSSCPMCNGQLKPKTLFRFSD